MKDRFFLEIKKVKKVKIYKNVSVKDDNNFKIDARFLYKIEISSIFAIKRVFEIIKKYDKKYFIIGMGSNVLFAKDYYQAVLIKLMPIKNSYLNIISGGDSVNYLNQTYIKHGISSLDFLSGVPCSVGGAIYMNAGAFNESIAQIIEYVYIYDIEENKYKVYNNKECKFAYRHSCFQNKKIFIVGAKIKLNYLEKEKLKNIHNKRLQLRRSKLPLEYPNLGSVFKNPDSKYAGEIIDKLGFKGLKVGGCMVSEKHANVIINYDNGSYKDIIKLIEIIKDEVYIKYKINLELEIIIFK